MKFITTMLTKYFPFINEMNVLAKGFPMYHQRAGNGESAFNHVVKSQLKAR